MAFGRGCGFASGRLLGATGPRMESTIGRRSQFLLVLGHEAHPKTTLYGVVFQKIERAPAYGSAWWRPAVPGDHPFGKNLSIALSLLEAGISCPSPMTMPIGG